MPESRHFWVLDDSVLQYVRFARFDWWQIVLIAGGLFALFAYVVLAVVLDRRSRARSRRIRHLTQLETWLEAAGLGDAEREALGALAGDDRPETLYRLLSDPVRFETQVHLALERGEALSFAGRLREVLGYHSGNGRVPVVSTRQLVPGDHFRFVVWEVGHPRHQYGVVVAVQPGGLLVELTEEGYQVVRARLEDCELFYLHEDDRETRFPMAVRSLDEAHHRLLLAHRLREKAQRPRGTRLPIVRPVTFHLRPTPEPAGEPGSGERGVLLELSEGGFSLVLQQQLAEGSYVEFLLPRPRRDPMTILGRVLNCRPFTANRWLVRCEMRGLTSDARGLLGQLLRLELHRRLRRKPRPQRPASG
jgi:hypothetical protein